MKKDRVLFISHVWPFPDLSGQRLRVRYTLQAAARKFDVDFLTYAPAAEKAFAAEQIAALGCRPIVLESQMTGAKRFTGLLASWMHVLRTGMKTSNYVVGDVELSPERIGEAVNPRDYSAVIYEYLHAVNSARLFQDEGAVTILDMHNVLWKVQEQRLQEQASLPAWAKKALLTRYRNGEERAWNQFDALVAINRLEYEMVRDQLKPSQKLFYAPMGTDLSAWPYCWQPAKPLRIAYYGGLRSSHNEAAALQCHDRIMPEIWKKFPEAELWLVGSNPSDRLRGLASNPLVKVTGFVEKVQEVLRGMSLVLCPWSGSYGFRSRIIEVMALGVTMIASTEAVDGMELRSGQGIHLADSNEAMSAKTLELLSSPHELAAQSRLARAEVERLYSLENTYDAFITDLRNWMDEAKEKGHKRKPLQQSR